MTTVAANVLTSSLEILNNVMTLMKLIMVLRSRLLNLILTHWLCGSTIYSRHGSCRVHSYPVLTYVYTNSIAVQVHEFPCKSKTWKIQKQITCYELLLITDRNRFRHLLFHRASQLEELSASKRKIRVPSIISDSVSFRTSGSISILVYIFCTHWYKYRRISLLSLLLPKIKI